MAAATRTRPAKKVQQKRAAAGKARTKATRQATKKGRVKKSAAPRPAGKKATARKPAARKPATRKPAAKKPATRKSAAGRPAARSKAVKAPAKAARKPASRAAKKADTGKASKKHASQRAKAQARVTATDESTVLSMDELAEVADLVADATPKVAPKPVAKVKKRGPKTPTEPRAVKPPPKMVESEMSDEVLAFVDAIDKYRQEHCRPFPNWTEIFYIMKRLGYRKS